MTVPYDLICFSHLRWGFVYQRPNHLLSRCAKSRRVFFFEEPQFDAQTPHATRVEPEPGLTVVTPHLPSSADAEEMQRNLVDSVVHAHDVREHVLWMYTPMALPLARALEPIVTVYDCMDELAAFRGAPPILRERERELFERADVVFTGGRSIYEAKRAHHANVHAFPSSVDRAHFETALRPLPDPADQIGIGHPRIGWFGVIDERLDYDLLRSVAAARPEWSFIMIGPVVKVDPAELPRARNIHWLGPKTYNELPSYLAGWNVAMMPFALNEATRFISPTKTLEYIAAGKPVVSTAIRDVVHPYGENGVVRIADAKSFVRAIESALDDGGRDMDMRAAADAILAETSWDRTWQRMETILHATIARTTRTTCSTI